MGQTDQPQVSQARIIGRVREQAGIFQLPQQRLGLKEIEHGHSIADDYRSSGCRWGGGKAQCGIDGDDGGGSGCGVDGGDGFLRFWRWLLALLADY